MLMTGAGTNGRSNHFRQFVWQKIQRQRDHTGRCSARPAGRPNFLDLHSHGRAFGTVLLFKALGKLKNTEKRIPLFNHFASDLAPAIIARTFSIGVPPSRKSEAAKI